MCGRYTLSTDAQKLARHFDMSAQLELFPSDEATRGEQLESTPRAETFDPPPSREGPGEGVAAKSHSEHQVLPKGVLPPRYNIAPSQPILAIRTKPDLPPSRSEKQWAYFRWGLVPPWADDISIGYRMINARSETVTEKNAFKKAFMRRRCLIPADGFFEWERVSPSKKQPYLYRMADEEPFAFAGLWEHWQDEHGNELETATILTTQANELLAKVHDRMPVIISPEDYGTWLSGDPEDPNNPDATRHVTPLLKPLPAELMITLPVSTYVNSPKHDGPRCVEHMPSNLFEM